MRIRFTGLKEKKDPEVESQEKVAPEKKEHSPLFFLSWFLVIVGVCILGAIIIRVGLLISKSTFNTSSYIVLVSSKTPFLASLDTVTPALHLVSVSGITGESRIKKSLQLGVPIDGEIQMPGEDLSKQTFPSVTLLISILLRPFTYFYHEMTMLDASRFIFSSLSLSQKTQRYSLSISKTGEIIGITSSQLYDIFKDPTTINEKISIEIVNATSVEGLAGRVGQVLKNMGGNVVSITSGEEKDRSTIIAKSNSTTVTRASHILSIPVVIEENYHGITDMKIVIGKDFGTD